MPGLASADPHTLATVSITRTNGGSRSNRMFDPSRNAMIMDSLEPARTGRYQNGFCQRENDMAGPLDPRAAEESLMLYCRPVELYNIIQRRALRNPIFLQRCLNYKIQVSQQKRIKMSVSIPKVVALSNEPVWNTNLLSPLSSQDSELQDQFLLVFVMLTSCASTPGMSTAVFRLNQSKVLKVPLVKRPPAESPAQTSVTFILPELQKLILTAKKDGDAIVFITNGVPVSASSVKSMMQMSSLVHANGLVFWGSVSVSAICNVWNNQWHKGASGTGVVAGKVVSDCQLDLHASKMLLEGTGDDRCLRFQPATNGMVGKYNVRLQVSVSGEEMGKSTVKDRFCDGMLGAAHYSVLSHVRRFRAGLVRFFYYYYYNQRYKSEVTEKFSCPFCLVCCGSFKGLSCHLNASHDLFSFEFLVTPELQAVNVTCRSDMLGLEGNVRDVDGLNDPRSKNFVYWSRCSRPRKISGTSQIVRSVAGNEKQPSEKLSLNITKSTEEGTMLAQSELPSELMSSQQTTLFDGQPPLNEESNAQCSIEKIVEQSSATICETVSTRIIASESESEVKDMLQTVLLKKHGRLEEGKKEDDDCMVGASITTETEVPNFKKARCEDAACKEDRGQVSSLSNLDQMEVLRIGLVAAGNSNIDCSKQINGNLPISPAGIRVEKIKRISLERAEARNRLLLQKRQFYHSRTAQPMDLEQLLSDKDSEDEIDGEVADIEDRRMLDDFVDVTKDEKEVMHLWNSFVRRQRVHADGHCPWACEAFAALHAKRFSKQPALRRCLMLLLIKLWNHHLIDASAVSRSLLVVDSYKDTLA